MLTFSKVRSSVDIACVLWFSECYWPVLLSRFQLLMKRDKNDSKAPFSMAMLAMDMQDYIASEKYFKIAIKVQHNTGMFYKAVRVEDLLHRVLKVDCLLQSLEKIGVTKNMNTIMPSDEQLYFIQLSYILVLPDFNLH